MTTRRRAYRSASEGVPRERRRRAVRGIRMIFRRRFQPEAEAASWLAVVVGVRRRRDFTLVKKVLSEGDEGG